MNTRFGWIPANSLTSKNEIMCPAQLVSLRYFKDNVKTLQNETKSEPMLRWSVSTGLATAKKIEEAIAKGVLEIIERDAYIITYLNKISPPVIDLEYLSYQDEELERVFQSFKRYHLEVYSLKLLSDFSVNAVASIIIDRSGLGPAFTIGNSAKFDLKEAILSSLSEALTIRFSLKGKFEKAINVDKKSMRNKDRVIYWSKPENLPKINFLLEGPKIKIDLAEGKNFFDAGQENEKEKTKNELEKMISELKSKNMEACWVEISDSQIRKLGLHCVQVVIPRLQPMHLNESIPYLGGKRLKSVPEKLGYQPARELNSEPHPFS